jgi:hypothetical protein
MIVSRRKPGGVTMSKSQSKLQWHLSRGDEASRLITERELQLLIELGQLKDSDRLWKPGQIGWQRVDAIPGVLAPSALPQEKIKSSTAARRIMGAILLAQERAKWLRIVFQVGRARFVAFCRIQFELFNARAQKGAEHLQQGVDRTKGLRWIYQPGGIAILMGLTLLFGALNFAIQGFAVEAEPALQDFHEASLDAHPAALTNCPQPKKETMESASNVGTFAGFALLTDSNEISQADSIALEPVPLPTRKPAKASSDKPSTRSSREHKPIRFGTLGFAYDPQN